LRAGVDEVGRGSLFGPVVAAAVILDPAYRIRGLRDSKLLLPEEGRCWQSVFANMRLHGRSLPWMPRASTRSTFIKRRESLCGGGSGLQPSPDHLLIDALMLDCDLPQRAIIHGDALSASIAAASIVAKVERDRMVAEWDPVFPVYGLASNKGYSTPRHLTALREHARLRCTGNHSLLCGTRRYRRRFWSLCSLKKGQMNCRK